MQYRSFWYWWWFNVNLAYFDIRICVGLSLGCCLFIIGLYSGLSVCCRLWFQQCANDRFSVGVMSVIYGSQIGRFHTESYPKWYRHEPGFTVSSATLSVADRCPIQWKLCVFVDFVSVGWCDWDITLLVLFTDEDVMRWKSLSQYVPWWGKYKITGGYSYRKGQYVDIYYFIKYLAQAIWRVYSTSRWVTETNAWSSFDLSSTSSCEFGISA